MIRISSEAELLQSFRSLDRDEVQLPPDVRFPMAIKDYHAWTEPSGRRVYLVFEDTLSGKPLGVVFQRTHGSADTAATMCQWCHTVRSGSAVSLLTATASKQRRVGLHLCSDLNCRERVSAPPGINDFNEGLSRQERLQRVLWRMSDFARRNLF